MSLVQFTLTHNYILVGGDTRASDANANVISENYNKVIKIGTGIIIGCSGNAYDAYLLLSDYCDYSQEYGITCKKDINSSYLDIIDVLNSKFAEMSHIHIKNKNDRYFDFTIVVCGFNGKEFEATQYCLSNDLTEKNLGITSIKINKKSGVTCFLIGSDKIRYHNQNRFRELEKIHPDTILQHKNIMQNVFDKGIAFDKTINNKCVYEKVRRKDVLQ